MNKFTYAFINTLTGEMHKSTFEAENTLDALYTINKWNAESNDKKYILLDG